jgi:hypothetical protein
MGKTYPATLDLYGKKTFCRIEIRDVIQEPLGYVAGPGEAEKEGGYSLAEYYETLRQIQKKRDPLDLSEYVFRVEFRVVGGSCPLTADEIQAYEVLYYRHLAEIRKILLGRYP